MAKFLCDIVTPETLLFSEEINFISVPATEGEIGILAMRSPVMSTLNLGEIRVKREEGDDPISFAVGGGYLEAVGTKVVILASRAAEVSSYDLDDVQTNKADFEKKLTAVAADDARAAFYRDEFAWYTLLENLLSKK